MHSCVVRHSKIQGLMSAMGSKADVTLLNFDVRYSPESCRDICSPSRQLRAISRHYQPEVAFYSWDFSMFEAVSLLPAQLS
jgi:hypothetical protein